MFVKIFRMIILYLNEFPFYEKNPREGITLESDSKVFDLEFQKDGHDYEVRALISIVYNRYFSDGDSRHPGEDYAETLEIELDIFKGIMYKGDDEHILGDKELRKIKKYLTENIELI